MLHSISGLEVDLGHKFQSGYGYFLKYYYYYYY